MLLEAAALLIALASLAACGWLLARVTSLESRISLPAQRVDSTPALPDAEGARPLEGLRVSIEIDQDQEHLSFVDLLVERLMKAGVEDIVGEGGDVAIRGKVVCNGYSDVYFSADLTCSSGSELICRLSEKPPDGDRQANLAIEVVAKLASRMEELVRRTERKQALRELRGE